MSWPASCSGSVQAASSLVLTTLLGDANAGGRTVMSIHDAVRSVPPANLDPKSVAVLLLDTYGWFTPAILERPRERVPLLLTEAGSALAVKVDAAADAAHRDRAARWALLGWCYDHPVTEFLALEDIGKHDRSWYFGTRLTSQELAGAARALHGRSLIFLILSGDHYILQLTAAGAAYIESAQARRAARPITAPATRGLPDRPGPR